MGGEDSGGYYRDTNTIIFVFSVVCWKCQYEKIVRYICTWIRYSHETYRDGLLNLGLKKFGFGFFKSRARLSLKYKTRFKIMDWAKLGF